MIRVFAFEVVWSRLVQLKVLAVAQCMRTRARVLALAPARPPSPRLGSLGEGPLSKAVLTPNLHGPLKACQSLPWGGTKFE